MVNDTNDTMNIYICWPLLDNAVDALVYCYAQSKPTDSTAVTYRGIGDIPVALLSWSRTTRKCFQDFHARLGHFNLFLVPLVGSAVAI